MAASRNAQLFKSECLRFQTQQQGLLKSKIPNHDSNYGYPVSLTFILTLEKTMAPLAQHGFSHNPPAFLPQSIFQKTNNINWYLVTPKSCLAHHHITYIYIYALSWYLFFWSYQICITFITTLKKQTTPKSKPRFHSEGLLIFLFPFFLTLHQPPRFFPHLLAQPKQRTDLGSIIHQQTFRKTLLDEGLCRLRELSPWRNRGVHRGLKSKTRGLWKIFPLSSSWWWRFFPAFQVNPSNLLGKTPTARPWKMDAIGRRSGLKKDLQMFRGKNGKMLPSLNL